MITNDKIMIERKYFAYIQLNHSKMFEIEAVRTSAEQVAQRATIAHLRTSKYFKWFSSK